MTRFCAAVAPALMVTYGVLRWIDGLNGRRKDGLAWDAGHIAFLIAIILFAALALSLRTINRHGTTARRLTADIAAAATLLGAACFAWVIVGDLNESFQNAAPLPDALEMIGPALFQVGLLTLLLQLVVARRLPFWSPLLVLAGFAAIAVDLDMLPFGSFAVAVGLLPLAAGPRSAALARV